MLAPLRWLLVPLAVGLFAVVGLALSVQNPPAQLDQPTGFEQTDGAEAPNRTSSEPTPAGDAAGSDVTFGPVEESTGGSSVDGTVDVEVASPAGGLGIDLGSPVPVVVGEDGTAAALDAGSLAGGEGLRLDAGGDLDPLPAGSGIGPSDLVVAPAPVEGGVDLLRPDGARVEIRSAGGPGPDGGTASVSVTSVDGSGTATPLRPDATGRIDLGSGVTVAVSATPDTTPSSSEDGPDPSNDPDDGRPWTRWLAVAAMTAILAGALVLLYRRRDSSAAGDGPASEPEPPIDLGRLADLIERLALDGDPARAIRLAFYAAGRGVGTLPARRSTETPAEWYHRSVETQPHLAPALNVLCNAFAAVRFAPTAPTLADRDEAVGALRQLYHLATDPETIAVYDRPSDTPLAGAGRR